MPGTAPKGAPCRPEVLGVPYTRAAADGMVARSAAMSRPDEVPRRPLRARLLALAPVLLAVLLHRRTLAGWFRSEDFLHLYQIANEGFLRFALSTHGGHVQVGRNVLWYAAYQLFGLRAELYYAALLALHAANVALLFGLARRLSGSERVGLLAATLFAVLPLAQETLAWISASGHALVGTCTLLLLRDAARVRAGEIAAGGRVVARWYLYLLLAATSYGTGLGIALLAPPVLLLLLPRGARRAALALLPLLVLLPLLYAWQRAAYEGAGIHATWPLQGAEKLALFAGVLVRTTAWGAGSLLLGPELTRSRYAVPPGGPFGDAAAALGLAVGLSAALLLVLLLRLRGSAERRAWIGAGLGLALAAYALVALGRGWTVPQVGLVDLCVTARYQYAGPLLLALALAAAAGPDASRAVRRGAVVLLLACAGGVAATLGSGVYAPDVYAPADGRRAFEEAAASLRAAVLAHPAGATVTLENRPFPPVKLLSKKYRFPGLAGVWVLAFPTNELEGRRVRFAEPNPRVLRAVRERPGTRAAELLVDAHGTPGSDPGRGAR